MSVTSSSCSILYNFFCNQLSSSISSSYLVTLFQAISSIKVALTGGQGGSSNNLTFRFGYLFRI